MQVMKLRHVDEEIVDGSLPACSWFMSQPGLLHVC